MSKRRRRSRPPSSTWSTISSPSPSLSPPPEDDDWYEIKEIVDERRRHGRLEYRVDWEGTDPSTGKPYKPSWISASEVTLDAIAEWQSAESTRATRLQGASPRPRTTPRVARPAAESSSGGRASATSSQEQRRAVSLQAGEPPLKRRRLRRAVTHPSSPVTVSQDREYHSSQQTWEAPDPKTPKAAGCVVELPPVHHLDKSDYLSVHLSQTSAEGAAQSSPYTQLYFSSQHNADSQRTIPDSQESQSHDTPDDPHLASGGLRTPIDLPLAPPASTSDSWPSIVSGSQERLASQESQWEQAPASSSLSSLLRRPTGEYRVPKGPVLPELAERSESSIPSRQPDSFAVQHDSQDTSNSAPSSHSVDHNSAPLQTNNGHHLSSLTHVSASASSGPQYLTQPQSVLHLPYTSQSSSAHAANSGGQDSIIPDSVCKSSRSVKSTQDHQSQNSHGADYGSAQPRGSLYYASQVVPNLLNTSEQLTGPDSSSIEDYRIPETVLRRPQQRLTAACPGSPSEPRPPRRESHPRRDRSPVREEAEPVSQLLADSLVTSPTMDNDHEPRESPAIAELFRIQSQFLSETSEPSLLGSAESAIANDGPHQGDSASPQRAMLDPVMLSSEVGGAQGDTMGPPLAPEAMRRTEDEPSAPTSQLFATQEQALSDGGAFSQAEGTLPVTVAPTDIQPAELDTLTVTPSDITTGMELPTTGSRQLPVHSSLFSERQHVPTDIPTDMTISEEEYEDDSLPRLAENEPKEFTVTLPFPANQRPFYDRMILQSRPDIESFCRIFSNEVLRTPKPSAVHKIESLFLRLLDICDYPPELDAASWSRLSPKEVQNYIYESNAKFAVIWDMLHHLREMPVKVMVVARSDRLLSFLETLALVEGFAFSRAGLGNMQFEHSRSPLSLVLSLPDQTLRDDPSEFDVIFGFDFEFKRSVVANRLAQLQPSQKHPMVLSLVIAHSLEHIDLCITDKDPDIPELDRKNALVVALTKVRGMVVNPEMGRAKPHKIAQHFASLLGAPVEPCEYEPVPIPDSVLDVYIDPTQPEERGSSDGDGGVNSRKRKLDDFDEDNAKRQKLNVPMVDAKRIEALSPLISCLGAEVLDGEGTADEVTVPRALLKAMEAKVNDQQRAMEESKKREQELKHLVTSLSQQNDDYSNSINTIQAHHHSAIEERAKFEKEKDAAESKAQSLETRLQALETVKVKLAAEVAELKAAPAPNTSGEQANATEPAVPAEPTDPDKDREASQAEVLRIKKRVENAERDLEYTREAYQNASQAASDLGNENRELAGRVRDLEHRASENLLAVHKANVENQVKELVRANDEVAITLREREAEIDRLREEVKAFKARRETRQASVPRSPRMGVMSPRSRMPGGLSRGSSPVPMEAGLQMFGQQGGNGRWGHLRD